MSTSRENSVYLAKLAEQAERYEGILPKTTIVVQVLILILEMVDNMKAVASADQELTVEGMCLFFNYHYNSIYIYISIYILNPCSPFEWAAWDTV